MSPRVAFALLCQGELLHDMLDEELLDGSMRMSIVEWCEYFDHTLEHLTHTRCMGKHANRQVNSSRFYECPRIRCRNPANQKSPYNAKCS